MRERLSEEAELGYLHYFYDVELYFSKTIVGRDKDTKGWTFSEYAYNFVEYEIENYSIYLRPDWSTPFKIGVREAHKDFMRAIHNYRASTAHVDNNNLYVTW